MRSTILNPTDGTEIAFEVSGSGEPVLLVHGSGLSKGTWRGLGYIREFERDFTVIALDLRGHGRSGKPHDASAYEPQRFIEDVDAVQEAAGSGPTGPRAAGQAAGDAARWCTQPRPSSLESCRLTSVPAVHTLHVT